MYILYHIFLIKSNFRFYSRHIKKYLTALFQLSYTRILERAVGLEPTTSGLAGLIFYINLLSVSLSFLIIYYNIFFKNCQEIVFRLDFSFFDYDMLHYIVSKLCNRRRHFSFYKTNSHLCLTKNLLVAEVAVYACSLNPFFSVSARSIKPLFTHLLVH